MSKQNPSSPLRLVRSSDEGFLPFSGANVLSAEQQAAIAHRGSPLIITGATGTGKTTVVIESALARITAGQSPDSILIIAYGRERAAQPIARHHAAAVALLCGLVRQADQAARQAARGSHATLGSHRAGEIASECL